jgi:uncharacterized membrane protein YbaN (DUF454 family)
MATASSSIPFVRAERSTLRRIYIIAVGWFFMLLAVAGWILPILPGWLFFAIGLLILSTEYAWAHHLVQRTKERFPKFGAVLDQAREKVERWF